MSTCDHEEKKRNKITEVTSLHGDSFVIYLPHKKI